MPQTTFKHQCTKCNKQYDQSTTWLDPTLYTDPEKATKTVAFWCPNRSCEKNQAVVLQMLPDGDVTVVDIVEDGIRIQEDSPSYYAQTKTTSETKTAGQLTEEAALSVIGHLNVN